MRLGLRYHLVFGRRQELFERRLCTYKRDYIASQIFRALTANIEHRITVIANTQSHIVCRRNLKSVRQSVAEMTLRTVTNVFN